MKKLNTPIAFFSLLTAGLAFLLLACEKDSGPVPIVTSIDVYNIGSNDAYCGGAVVSDEGSTVTSRGVCWSTHTNPTVKDAKSMDGAGAGAFTSKLTGLSPNTLYFVRAYATNANGTGYGNTMSFTAAEILTDIDGNVYHTVRIGTQTWAIENFRATHYRDGSEIPNITDQNAWGNSGSGACCDYNNDPLNSVGCGKLYNFYVFWNPAGLIPDGWHVPTVTDWEILAATLGGFSEAGGKLKEAGMAHWQNPNTGATNETGFTALPGGYRAYYGFDGLGTTGIWLSTTTYTDYWGTYVRTRFMDHDNAELGAGSGELYEGYSIRLVKD